MKRNGTRPSAVLHELPKELRESTAELHIAMHHDRDPSDPENFNDSSFLRAWAPATVAGILIPVYHRPLRTRTIAFLWRKDMKGRGDQIRLGQARVAAGMVRHFGKVDFVIEFNWTAWRVLPARARIALVDHELMHCTIEGDRERPTMVPHDVEEFGSIVRRWGLWKLDLQEFGAAVREAPQLSLFKEGNSSPPVEQPK